jgi:uncharacterized domain 1
MDDRFQMETTQQAREFFQKDRFASDNGMTIAEASLRHSVIKLQVNDSHLNAVGSLMGGVICTMADFACAVASNFGTGTGLFVSTDAHISFLSASKGKELTAEAVCVKHGNRLSFFEVPITDELGTLAAKASFTMCRIK